MNPTLITPYNPSDLVILLVLIAGLTIVALFLLVAHLMARRLKRQHRADREALLEQLIADRVLLDAQINALSMAILQDMEDDDATAKAERPAIDWDPTRRFPDPAPRSY